MIMRLKIGLAVILLSFCISGVAHSQSRSSSARASVSLRSSVTNPSKLFGEEFELLYEDRYFYIDNRGLTRVIVYLNGYQFKLAVDPEEVRRSANTYLIPSRGIVNIDILPLLNPQRNLMSIDGRGPAGTDATIVVADQLISGNINYVLNVVQLPRSVQLLQNFPNPFNPTTNIVYEVPQSFVDGVNIQLTIYNLLGQKVRTLVEGRNFPGSFTAQWNGADDSGTRVASGVYLYRLVVGKSHQTRRLVFTK